MATYACATATVYSNHAASSLSITRLCSAVVFQKAMVVEEVFLLLQQMPNVQTFRIAIFNLTCEKKTTEIGAGTQRAHITQMASFSTFSKSLKVFRLIFPALILKCSPCVELHCRFGPQICPCQTKCIIQIELYSVCVCMHARISSYIYRDYKVCNRGLSHVACIGLSHHTTQNLHAKKAKALVRDSLDELPYPNLELLEKDWQVLRLVNLNRMF